MTSTISVTELKTLKDRNQDLQAGRLEHEDHHQILSRDAKEERRFLSI